MDSGSAMVVLLDLLLVLWFVSQLVIGARYGIAQTGLWLGGLVAGGVLIWWWVPPVAEWTGSWGGPAAIPIAVGIALLGATAGIGAALGRRLTTGLRRARLGVVNRVLGAVAGLAAAAIVLVLVASGLRALGIPVVSQAISSSRVVAVVNGVLPAGLRGQLTHLGRDTVTDGIPWLIEAIDGVSDPPALPRVDLDSRALTQASASVVRVSGNAYACSTGQTGSGFVVAKNRIVTNAHVVAGAEEVVIEVPGERGRSGTVTYFDPDADLAVIRVTGLSAPALGLSAPLHRGEKAAFQGFPGGGPFVSRPAEVLGSGPVRFQGSGTRDVITLAADVRKGNSGGPLLALDGTVAGVVFAKEDGVENVGYAISLATLRPVAERAAGLTEAVGTGSCSRVTAD